MLRIVSGSADLKGLDPEQFYNVYHVTHDRSPAPFRLVAIASTIEEAQDALEILHDLTRGQYHISPPKSH